MEKVIFFILLIGGILLSLAIIAGLMESEKLRLILRRKFRKFDYYNGNH